MFEQLHPFPMTEGQTTAHAADLAERMLDEISSAEQNWAAVEHMANALAEIAARAARRTTAPGGSTADP